MRVDELPSASRFRALRPAVWLAGICVAATLLAACVSPEDDGTGSIGSEPSPSIPIDTTNEPPSDPDPGPDTDTDTDTDTDSDTDTDTDTDTDSASDPEPPAPPPPPPPPPESPDDDTANGPEARPPNPAQRALLRAIRLTFEAHGRDEYAETPEDLRVGDTSTIILTLKEPLAMRLRRAARQIASPRGVINVDVDARLVAGDRGAIAFDEEETPLTIVVNVSERTLRIDEEEGEMGQFAATPADAGDHDLWLWLKNPRINGEPVTRPPFYVPVGSVEVDPPPLGTTIEDWLLRAGALVAALGIIAGAGYGLWRRLRGKGTPGERGSAG